MSLLFPDSENLDGATLVSLTKAYDAACVELAAEHYFSSSQVAGQRWSLTNCQSPI
jgi:hypothetical protein